MTVTIVVPPAVSAELESAVMGSLETAGVLIASVVETNSSLRLLAREVHWVDEKQYVERTATGLSIKSEGYVYALARAEQLGGCAIWVHTHPGMGSSPEPSDHDRVVDQRIADLFRLRSSSRYYGALVLAAIPGGLTFAGHVDPEGGPGVSIDRMWFVGDRLRLVRCFSSKSEGLSPVFDRNIRAFGTAVQRTLGDLLVGIVGCGGTGSAVAEELARLGVRHLLLVDPDNLSCSNVSRVFGSTHADVGMPKVEVIKAHLKRIDPEIQVAALRARITEEAVARRLAECDVLFGCTDDNAGRLVLSRAATYFITPVIDCGVVLTSAANEHLRGIDGRVTVLTPGQACLVCRNRVDLRAAAAEQLMPAERAQRTGEGYAPALGEVTPAVVAFTAAVGSSAVAELLERLVGYGPEPRPSEVLLRFHERAVSTNVALPRADHYCNPQSGKIGAGITRPLLDQTWAT